MRSLNLLAARTALVAALFLLRASIGQSQTINGRVLEAGSDRPIAGVSLRLYNETGVTQAIAVSDGAGGFILRAARTGRYHVKAERLGYATATSPPFEVRAEVHSMTIMLVPSPVSIDTLRVTAETLLLEPGYSQFARRCKAETAICFNAARIARSGAAKVGDVFESVAGFAIAPPPPIVAAADRKNQASNVIRPSTTVRSFHGWGCFKVLVDHHGGVPADLDLNDISLDEVAAIEIYKSYREVPKELRQSMHGSTFWGCGVAIVWRKPAWGAPVQATVPR